MYDIYLVEDEENLNHLLTSYLEKEGWNVTSFFNGNDALMALKERNQPHLWILDIMLPDVDGFELLREIKAFSPDVPVIFISARDADLDRILGLELGSDDYLAKPFLPRELVIRAKKLLTRVYERSSTVPLRSSQLVHVPPYAIDIAKRRSYAESIEDGIFPKGNLEGSVSVIKQEAMRLEKRIKDLLYLTKLDYYATQEPKYETVNVVHLLEEVVERMQPNRPNLEFKMELSEMVITGDAEQWKIAFENILDNQMRYAQTQIQVNTGGMVVRIWNDGPQMEEHLLEQVFKKFQVGQKGKFGLGLAIVQRIAELHKAKVWAANENGGVAFYVQFTS
ncbi:response regulator [Geobacillus sp. 44B]|uniref:Uncharacterized protein n=2 Tax=Saccharococcus caldoxylosilyticus TaxID=81408 RepID=A0A150KTV7_9BACL|nr:hypothetical protein B4119_0406 [Parageobacillus caldoxylosilyticus]OQP02298.1 hypothetical protein BSK33_10790 [Geobacillus sp. 44B]QNU38400.1 response regulator [Geobacillus sp. 44B]BDG34449.1 hypothetical protein PcaKH15_03550 [Parageobacillus caldoxylosilyticus]BDG38221.1 hypothetical protein PcaKH16_03600 [Parageobacillus caldoxylosilyticus]